MAMKKKLLLGCGILLLIAGVSVPLLSMLAWHIALGPEQGRYFDSAGLQIYYTDDGRGVPVVLVHGFANPVHLQWRRPGRIDALSKEYRVIALDVRGHGRSGKPHDPSQYGVQMVEDLVRLLDHLRIEKAHIVGYSMGGFITLKMAALHPERVLSAAACGAGWEKATQENRDFAEAVAQAVENGESGPLLERLGVADRPLSFWERLAARISLSYFNDPLALAALARSANALALSEDELRSNAVPTLTIIGSKDGLLPDAKALAACMAHHELVVLEGKNHMNTDVSAEFLQTLRAFLARHTPSHDEVFAPAMLEPVELQHLRIGGFWKEQVKRLTEKWLPHCVAQMEAGGKGQELLNLVETGKLLRGEPHDKFRGLPWADAYVYNTIEAICLALAVEPEGDEAFARAQDFLRSKLEIWIPVILAAQSDDGYIHSFHCLKDIPRFSEIDNHEFYVMGYFIEMGVAHFRMTGGQDRRLYDAALKCAGLLCRTFGPPPRRTWKNGHPGLEFALCRLARLVDEVEGAGAGRQYLDLAKHFLDHQHEIKPAEYNQSHVPAVEMDSAAGHAVRATYFYTAMADVALMAGDLAYASAVDRIWSNAIHRKHYLTGGVGASEKGEAFAGDFELPHEGYCESCAGCGMCSWADRMHRLHGDAHYRDVQERVLYNNVLGAIELTGENFFYQNPLISSQARYPWHVCPCCVGNIPRTLLAIKDSLYSANRQKDALYVNHFVDSEAVVPDIAGSPLRIRQETEYPWQGGVKISLHPGAPVTFTLNIRIPDRTESELYTAVPDLSGRFAVRLNGEEQALSQDNGYVNVRRVWQEGDYIELELPMDIQRVHCDERVAANRGRVAIQRGPLVYNVEDVDHARPACELLPRPEAPLRPEWKEDLLGGVMVMTGDDLLAVPNFARLNRGGASQVWVMKQAAKAANP